MQFVEHPLAGPTLRIAGGDDEAFVALLGAQVVSWRHRGREMLWCAKTRLDGKPLRGGIPICWPWFGDHPTDSAKPAHGVARLADWQVVEQFADGVSLRLAAEGMTASLMVVLDHGLTLHLSTHNPGPAVATVTAALHTYLAVDDIGQVRVSGLDGAPYIDKVDRGARRTQQGDLRFAGEVDRIYAVRGATLHDGEHVVEVSSSRSSGSLVAWNPWTAKSARLGDMAEGDYRHMVCLETAWAGDETRTLSTHTNATLTTVLRPLRTHT